MGEVFPGNAETSLDMPLIGNHNPSCPHPTTSLTFQPLTPSSLLCSSLWLTIAPLLLTPFLSLLSPPLSSLFPSPLPPPLLSLLPSPIPSHLPLYLVASFAKRIARLTLTAPPNGESPHLGCALFGG